MRLSVIVPAYNEEKNLYRSIVAFHNYLSRQNYNYEIIIVNDGSNDNTVKVISELHNNFSSIKFINNNKNRGKGFVVRQGMLLGKGEYLLFLDADGATGIEHVEKIWPKFAEGSEIVIGSRHKKDAIASEVVCAQAKWKIYLGRFGNYIIRYLLVKNIKDTQCGFKALTKKAVQEILPLTTSNRWALDVEILSLAQKRNYKITIIPVRWKNTSFSRVGFKGYLIALIEVLKIKWKLITGKY